MYFYASDIKDTAMLHEGKKFLIIIFFFLSNVPSHRHVWGFGVHMEL